MHMSVKSPSSEQCWVNPILIRYVKLKPSPLRQSVCVWHISDKMLVTESAIAHESGVLVAAMTMTPSEREKPSISTSSWLTVIFDDSTERGWLKNEYPRRYQYHHHRPSNTTASKSSTAYFLFPAQASISSMKITQGAFCLASLNNLRIRLDPTPTNI